MRESVTSLMICELPKDVKFATKLVVDFLIDSLWPAMLEAKNKFVMLNDTIDGRQKDLTKLKQIFSLCCSQIRKCVLQIFEIFKIEHQRSILLQESRDSVMEQLSWCLDRLSLVISNVDKMSSNEHSTSNSLNESIMATPMYFVNWIDLTFELLTSLYDIVYKKDYKDTPEQMHTWKNEVIDCVSTLHLTVDELLLSAMTLCKYSLPGDQPVLTARCQVVLRETKNLISEIVIGDLNGVYKVTKDSLKLPINPSNVSVLIDVMKDSLYVLETNTNTALLALLVHCFSANVAPVDVLRSHFSQCTGDSCPCLCSKEEMDVECAYVKEFDFYNERLIQIGLFAVSCSADERRILSLRSGLASLEALDPHLVPALMTASGSYHATLLVNLWHREVHDIRTSICLIVDPAAFTEKSRQAMNKQLLDILSVGKYDNCAVCSVINIGDTVYEFFDVYNINEPGALLQRDKLAPLLQDLLKVLIECKTVSNLLCNREKDFMFKVPELLKESKQVAHDQLIKRLKLLFTIVNKVSNIFHTKVNDENSFETEDGADDASRIPNNVTHTVLKNKPSTTFVKKSARQIGNVSKSFARTAVNRSKVGQNSCIISKLSKHLNHKTTEDLSFSVKLDQLFNDISLYTREESFRDNPLLNKHLLNGRNCSIMYNNSHGKDKSSLRRAVLKRNINAKTYENQPDTASKETNNVSEIRSLMDCTVNLQITEILDQLSDISNVLMSTRKATRMSSSASSDQNTNFTRTSINQSSHNNNVLKLNINEQTIPTAKCVWNITVTTGSDGTPNSTMPSDISRTSSQPSDVTTLERISDLDLLENRLNSLKSLSM